MMADDPYAIIIMVAGIKAEETNSSCNPEHFIIEKLTLTHSYAVQSQAHSPLFSAYSAELWLAVPLSVALE